MSVNDNELTTTMGITLKLHGLPSLLVQKVKATVPEPELPTYTVTTVAGVVETHTFNNLDMEADPELETEENKKLWQDYVINMAAARSKSNDKLMKLLFMKGVEVEMPADNSWMEIQSWLGVEIPDTANKLDFKYHYIITECIGSPEEIQTIMERVMRLSGLSEETLQKAQSMFRGEVAEPTSKEEIPAS